MAELADGLGLAAVDGVAPASLGRRRRRAVVRLVHDQQVEERRAALTGAEDLVEQALHPRRTQPRQADDHARVDRERVGLQSVRPAHRR